MPVFAYRGRTRTGQLVAGQMEANTQEAVVAQLRQQRVMATSVKPKPKPIQLKIPGFSGQGHIDLWNDDKAVGHEYWGAETIWMWVIA